MESLKDIEEKFNAHEVRYITEDELKVLKQERGLSTTEVALIVGGVAVAGLVVAGIIYLLVTPPPPPPPTGPGQYTEKVTVLDANTRQPIPGATVTVDGNTQTTASDGTASFTLSPGSYTISVTASGYQTATQPLTMPSYNHYDTILLSKGPPPPPTGAPLTATLLPPQPSSGSPPLAVQFNVQVSGGTPPYSYQWDFGDGGTSTMQNPVHTYTTSGTYTAKVTVTDSTGTQATYPNGNSVTITVSQTPPTTPGQANIELDTSASSAGSDPYARYVGISIDDPDGMSGRFWETNPSTVVGVYNEGQTITQSQKLSPGSHTMYVGVSVYAPNPAWHVVAKVNGQQVGEGDVSVGNPLRVTFTV